MPIKIVLRDDLYCPVFICDRCGGEIVNSSGNYEWDSSDFFGEIFFTHKWCSYILGARKPFKFRMSEELSKFCGNLQKNFEQSHDYDEGGNKQ